MHSVVGPDRALAWQGKCLTQHKRLFAAMLHHPERWNATPSATLVGQSSLRQISPLWVMVERVRWRALARPTPTP